MIVLDLRTSMADPAVVPDITPWWDSNTALAAVVGIVLLGALWLCLRGTLPDQRPAIIQALAELFKSFRWWFRPGGPPDGGAA